jgi:hypothetical protein
VSYPGGKGGPGVYQRIINLMPPHDTYIECFLGAGAVLRHKRPAARSIGIDIDETVLGAWRGDEVPHLSLVQHDAIAYLQSRDSWSGRELVYCDPPYLRSTRRSARSLYRYELGDGQHEELLFTLRTLPCPVLVSGYQSRLYERLLAGWRHIEFGTTTRGNSAATEVVWANFNPPVALHDYRYLGDTFRDRERHKRRIARWTRRLQGMDIYQAASLLAAMQDLDIGGPAHASLIRTPTESSRERAMRTSPSPEVARGPDQAR